MKEGRMRHGRSRLRLRLRLRPLARPSAALPPQFWLVNFSPRHGSHVASSGALQILCALRLSGPSQIAYNNLADYAQSGRCLQQQQQQATSVSVLVVLHVLRVGQRLRTVASSSRIHWRAAPCLDWAFDLVSGVPYPAFVSFFSRSPFFSLSIRIGIDPPLSLCTLHLYLFCAPMM